MSQVGFWVFQCKKCGRWGVKEIRKNVSKATFGCKFCHKRWNIDTKARYGLNLNYRIEIKDRKEVPFADSKKAGDKCREMNKNVSEVQRKR